MLKYILLLTICICALAHSAFACACGSTGSPKESLRKSAAVFSGKVIQIEQDKVQFKVLEGWKGVTKKEVWLTQSPSSNCDYHFKKGSDYLVYAYAPQDKKKSEILGTSICTRTRELAKANDDIVELGEAQYRPTDK